MPAGVKGGVAFRIQQGQYVGLYVASLVGSGNTPGVFGRATVEYDDGTLDYLYIPQTSVPVGQYNIPSINPAAQNGWIVGITVRSTGTIQRNALFLEAFIVNDPAFANIQELMSSGYLVNTDLMLGQNLGPDQWACYVVQGTVAEDATVGTHTCTLTIKPGAGAEAEFLYGSIIATGLAGLAQSAAIMDGSYTLTTIFSASAAGTYNFPYAGSSGAVAGPSPRWRFSGNMSLVLTATTSTVSDTQTFAAVFLYRGTFAPTVTLADNTGTPTLTYNLSKVE